MKKKLYKISIFIFLWLIANQTFAQPNKLAPIIIDSEFKELTLSGLVDIYTTDKLMNVDSVWQKINDNKLTKIPSDNFFPGLGDKFYWLIIKTKNTSNLHKEVIIEVNNPQIDTIYFYEVLKNNSINLLSESGDEIPFNRRVTRNELPVFSIDLEADKEKTYILMLRKRKINKFPSKIYDKKVFESHSRKKILTYGLYFGSVFLIFIASLVIGLLIKNKTLVYYSLYIIFMGAYIITESGYAYEFIYPNLTWLNSPMRVPVSMIALIFFLIFSNLFINTEKYKNKLHKAFKIIYISWLATYFISLPFVNIYPHFYHSFILIAHYFFILFSLALMLITVSLVFKHNKKDSFIYLFAITIFIGGIVVYYIPQFGLINKGITSYHPMLFASIGEFTIFTFALFINIRKVNIEKNKLTKLTAIQEKEILTAHIKGDEHAKKRISSELHDNISSRLALLKNKVQEKKINNNEIINDLAKLYSEVRDISSKLTPNSFFLLGCSNYIKEYLQDINDNSELTINTKFYCDTEAPLDDDTGFQIFRIIQEASQNCVKYAGEANVVVQIIMHKTYTSITIDDDGNGFDQNNELLLNGNGLGNMKMRTKILNGKFEITSEIGKGTNIIVSIPR